MNTAVCLNCLMACSKLIKGGGKPPFNSLGVIRLFKKKYEQVLKSFDELEKVIFPSEPYLTIVEASFNSVSKENLFILAQKLIATKAMVVAAIGENCELFHDIVDEEYVYQEVMDPKFEVPGIMTTWHNDETLKDVIEFLDIADLVLDGWEKQSGELLILKIV